MTATNRTDESATIPNYAALQRMSAPVATISDRCADILFGSTAAAIISASSIDDDDLLRLDAVLSGSAPSDESVRRALANYPSLPDSYFGPWTMPMPAWDEL